MDTRLRSSVVVSLVVLTCLLNMGIPEKARAEESSSVVIKAPDGGGTGVALPAASTVSYNSVTGATPSPGEICLATTTYKASEGVRRKIVLKRLYGTKGKVSATYTTTSKTAVSGIDFISKKGTVTWADGDSADKIVKIDILQDGLAEPNETFLFKLTSSTGAPLIAPIKAVVTIGANTVPVASAGIPADIGAAEIPGEIWTLVPETPFLWLLDGSGNGGAE
jgi:hypothetical protein